MVNYDKEKIRDSMRPSDYFDLLTDFGGEPEYTTFGIISSTICHNLPGEGSRKLYWYENSGLFRCYTQCGTNFDVFELIIKVYAIQHHIDMDLNTAVRWLAQRLGIAGDLVLQDEGLGDDWDILKEYERIQEIVPATNHIILKEYDDSILDKFDYTCRIEPWLEDGISQEVIEKARIGFYPGDDMITIPHYDADGRFIGLRGRTLVRAIAEMYGKYRPLYVNQTLYTHPLGMNLYGLNWAKEYIKQFHKAIIVESEKSVLQYMTFGMCPIAVACCGSSFSAHQFQLLQDCGVDEIIIAFDKDFEKIGDSVYEKQLENLKNLKKRFGNYVNMTFIFDRRNNTLPLKASPTDCGKETFLKLYNERITL